MTRKRSSISPWLIAALALALPILFAYMGQFSRPINEDYCYLARAREMGAWDAMIHRWNTWTGAYSYPLFFGPIEPLGVHSAAIVPTVVIGLWLAGLFLLVLQCLAYLKIDRWRRALSVTIAALTVAAAINAFYSPQSFYWATVIIRFALPLTLLAVYMALALWTARRPRRDTLASLGIIAGGLLCFISAGFSEMYLVFQTAFLAFCLLVAVALAQESMRRSYALVFGVGWLATLCSLGIQLISPGIAVRMDGAEYNVIRSISGLAAETWHQAVDYMNRPPVVLGFVMLMAVGLLVMLIHGKPPSASETAKPAKLALPPLWLGLIFQLLYMPPLWGRGSMGAIFNAAFILGFLLLLWQRNHINARLRQYDRGRLIVYGAMALVFGCAALFVISSQSLLHRATSNYLYVSLLVLGGMMIGQLSSLLSTLWVRRLGLLAILSYVLAAVCTAAMFAASLYGIGFMRDRVLSPVAFILVMPGLLWGAYIGCALKHCGHSSLGGAWVRFLKSASAVIVLTIGISIALDQAALIPNFQLYAREWDARHQHIIAMRNSGETVIEAAPLTWDLTSYLGVRYASLTVNTCANHYYGVKLTAPRDS